MRSTTMMKSICFGLSEVEPPRAIEPNSCTASRVHILGSSRISRSSRLMSRNLESPISLSSCEFNELMLAYLCGGPRALFFRQNDRRPCGPRTMIRENGRMKVMIMYSSEIQDGDRRFFNSDHLCGHFEAATCEATGSKRSIGMCAHVAAQEWVEPVDIWMISVDICGSSWIAMTQRSPWSPVSRCRESWPLQVCGGAGGRLCAFCGADSSGCGGMSR